MFQFTNPFQYGDSFSPKVEHILQYSEHIYSNTSSGIGNFFSSSINATTAYSGSFARHLPSNDSYDAIVVGGGHNGLVAAAYLAKSGVK